jgi:hypothetical protein
MPVRRIAERVSTPFARAAVDREHGVIRGVKLCGGTSANGRDYPPEVFRRDVGKYEGAAIYADHGRDRSVDRKLGWIESPRVDADGTPRGDAHLLKTHPLYDRVMEAAERNPALFGFSHVALCETSFGPDGRERVDGLRAVESVDLVAEPATTKGIFEDRRAGGEAADGTPVPNDDPAAWLASVSLASFPLSHTNRRSVMPVTIRELAAWVTRHPRSTTRQILACKRLSEMDAGAVGDEPAADTLPPDAAEPADAVTGGFKAALMSVIERAMGGRLELPAAIRKVKSLLAAHSLATADDDDMDDGGADDTVTDAPERPSSESRQDRRPAMDRPRSAARHRLTRHAEADSPSERFPEDGLAFARWVAD